MVLLNSFDASLASADRHCTTCKPQKKWVGNGLQKVCASCRTQGSSKVSLTRFRCVLSIIMHQHARGHIHTHTHTHIGPLFTVVGSWTLPMQNEGGISKPVHHSLYRLSPSQFASFLVAWNSVHSANVDVEEFDMAGSPRG